MADWRRLRSAQQSVMAGYSGTPLAKKLGIKPEGTLVVQNGPAHYSALVTPLPPGVKTTASVSQRTDIVHIFSTSKADLIARLKKAVARMRSDAAIWVSWPKKASKVPTDITEDTIREVAFPLGLVDVKVCAVDEVWSGLKLVVRKQHRTGR